MTPDAIGWMPLYFFGTFIFGFFLGTKVQAMVEKQERELDEIAARAGEPFKPLINEMGNRIKAVRDQFCKSEKEFLAKSEKSTYPLWQGDPNVKPDMSLDAVLKATKDLE